MNVFIAIFVVWWSAIKTEAQNGPSTQCYNPNQRMGTCISIYECAAFMPGPPKDTNFAVASKCGGGHGDMPIVCCTSDTTFTRRNEPREQPSDPTTRISTNLLPQPPKCGGVTMANRIFGGDDADLFEFPWMVMLEYKKSKADNISVHCGGSLINDRYVLTAAHCVSERSVDAVGSLASIRLGEHDQTTQIDCNSNLCAPEAIRVGIDEITPHELYKGRPWGEHDDIALIRLDRKIDFSDSMRPICLPSAMEQEQNEQSSGVSYTVAGWGYTLKGFISDVMQKLVMKSISNQLCQHKYTQYRVKITDSQLCAGGEFGKDSCKGDSGGPLMRFRDNAWVLDGIISFGNINCGRDGTPAVHTRVASYDDWIRSKIRA